VYVINCLRLPEDEIAFGYGPCRPCITTSTHPSKPPGLIAALKLDICSIGHRMEPFDTTSRIHACARAVRVVRPSRRTGFPTSTTSSPTICTSLRKSQDYSERLFFVAGSADPGVLLSACCFRAGREPCPLRFGFDFGDPSTSTCVRRLSSRFTLNSITCWRTFSGAILRACRVGSRALRAVAGQARGAIQAVAPDVANGSCSCPEHPLPEFMQLCKLRMSSIDTIHFNGMNTSLEALAVGTPVVTLPKGLHRAGQQRGRTRRPCIGRWKFQTAWRRMSALRRHRCADCSDRGLRGHLKRAILERSGVLFESAPTVRDSNAFARNRIGASGSIKRLPDNRPHWPPDSVWREALESRDNARSRREHRSAREWRA